MKIYPLQKEHNCYVAEWNLKPMLKEWSKLYYDDEVKQAVNIVLQKHYLKAFELPDNKMITWLN